MKAFREVNKVFIKSNNSTMKIFNRYLYCLIPFILLIIIYNLIYGNSVIVINLLKSISISLVTSIITGYILSIIKKEKNIKQFLFNDNVLTIAIIIGLFSIDASLIVIMVASIVSIVLRKILKNTTISASLYGILIVLISLYFNGNLDTPLINLKGLGYVDNYNNIVKSYGSILSYTLGLKYYLSPLLAIISFIYLFFKKSIKYNIVFSYMLTFLVIMLSIGLFNGMNIWYLFFQLCTGNILFLVVFCLTDYPSTPIVYEGQVIYGIILGIITSILRFIVPELSVVISLILGPILLTKIIDKISYKLKYNKKFYYLFLSISMCLVIVTSIIINILL